MFADRFSSVPKHNDRSIDVDTFMRIQSGQACCSRCMSGLVELPFVLKVARSLSGFTVNIKATSCCCLAVPACYGSFRF
jgi:hypothetical protein